MSEKPPSQNHNQNLDAGNMLIVQMGMTVFEGLTPYFRRPIPEWIAHVTMGAHVALKLLTATEGNKLSLQQLMDFMASHSKEITEKVNNMVTHYEQEVAIHTVSSGDDVTSH